MVSNSLVSWEGSIFRQKCHLPQHHIFKCFFGPNRILILQLRLKATHNLLIHTHRPPTTRYSMGRSSCLFMSLAHIALMELSLVFHISKCWEILLHQNQGTEGSWSSCGFSKMVLISHWVDIKSSVKHSKAGGLVVVVQHPLCHYHGLCSLKLTTPDNSLFQCIIIKSALSYELLLMMPSPLLTL